MKRLLSLLIVIPLIVTLVVVGYVFLNYLKRKQELQMAYEDYLTAKVLAYETFDTSLLPEVTTEQWFHSLDEHVKARQENGIAIREEWEIVTLRVLEYSDSRAKIRSARRYIALNRGETAQDYPDYLWQIETLECTFVREAGRWKVDQCENIIPSW